MMRARIRNPSPACKTVLSLLLCTAPPETFPSFVLFSFHGSLSTPRIVPWQQLKPSRAYGLCLMKPTQTLCESSPLGSPCPSCWMTPLALLAHSLPLSSVGEREYIREQWMDSLFVNLVLSLEDVSKRLDPLLLF